MIVDMSDKRERHFHKFRIKFFGKIRTMFCSNEVECDGGHFHKIGKHRTTISDSYFYGHKHKFFKKESAYMIYGEGEEFC